MTTRRGLFGLLAGALGLAAGVKATSEFANGGIASTAGLPLVGEIPSESFVPYDYWPPHPNCPCVLTEATAGEADGVAYLVGSVDLDTFARHWEDYAIQPTTMWCNPRAAAYFRASAEIGRLDLFGWRVRARTEKYLREYEATPAAEELEA